MIRGEAFDEEEYLRQCQLDRDCYDDDLSWYLQALNVACNVLSYEDLLPGNKLFF